jgi:ribose-phosphate pyrophosphokinase
MVRNIVVLGGSAHPSLTQTICEVLGVEQGQALFSKFSVGETRVEIGESVRGKDVYIIQSGGGKVNDHFIELLIAISACKTASAKKVTAVLPLFPYSRQSDVPYNKSGAPLVKAANMTNKLVPDGNGYTFDSIPPTPHPDKIESNGLPNGHSLHTAASKTELDSNVENSPTYQARFSHYRDSSSQSKIGPEYFQSPRKRGDSNASMTNGVANHDFATTSNKTENKVEDKIDVLENFKPRPGYRQWVAQAGTLVADLLTCAGADHVITMDLHDPQYQGFFDIPVDNLYGRPLLKKYIQQNIPDYKNGVVVSPDAGGAKRATAIADALGMEFALIHKERRPTKITDRQNATMMLVGDVTNRVAILIDDLADTSNTITRAAKLLKKEGASKVYALVTHGVLSGDAIERINASALDTVIVTNTVDQSDHCKRCPKLEVLEVGHVFAEVSFDRLLSCLEESPLTQFCRLSDEFTMVKVSVCSSSTTRQIGEWSFDIYESRISRRQKLILLQIKELSPCEIRPQPPCSSARPTSCQLSSAATAT